MFRHTLAAIALGIAALPAAAQDFPTESVNYIIPFGPGGESDITARFQQPHFQELFDEDLVITYKPGGGGAVGWSQLNSLSADGSTIMGINLPHIIVKPKQGNVGFQTEDIVPVHMFHYTPDAIVVRADSEFETIDDLIAAAKDNPRQVIFSGSGKGTANHLAQVRFDEMAEIDTTYVAFDGTGSSTTANLGGQVSAQWGYTTVGATQGDEVRLLAVAMEERHPLFPDVPTFAELGYDLVSGAYRGIAVPQDMPEEMRHAVADAIQQINDQDAFRQKMEENGFALLDVAYGEDMDAFMAEQAEVALEAARSGDVIE
jgi:tripartite-type tricarboxylate transporter receptor subunit TctC